MFFLCDLCDLQIYNNYAFENEFLCTLFKKRTAKHVLLLIVTCEG